VDVGEYNSVVFELGIREGRGLAANFHAADALIEGEMRDVVAEHVELFDHEWESLIPVDTGRMRDRRHIIVFKSGLGFNAGWDASDFYGDGVAFYPFFQEFGTYKMRAQPSLGPAYESIAPHFKTAMRTALRAAIARLDQRSQ
jgi:HK97 gp10 family phage protein